MFASRVLVLIVTVCASQAAFAQLPEVVFVDWESPNPTWPFKTWDTAAHTIQDAIDVAPTLTFLDTEIMVAEGTYVPPAGALELKTNFFQKTALRGGYDGCRNTPNCSSPGSVDPNAPDGSYTRTILLPGPNGGSILTMDHSSADLQGSVVIDGFKVKDATTARAVVVTGDNGSAGLQVMLENITFRNNLAGAVSALNFSGSFVDRLEMRFCKFIGNDAKEGGAINIKRFRGGMTLVNCLFRDNGSNDTVRGGAIYIGENMTGPGTEVDGVAVANCVFQGNLAGDPNPTDPPNDNFGYSAGQGGAVYYEPGNATGTVTHLWAHCTFTDNRATNTTGIQGGAMFVFRGTDGGAGGASRTLAIENCIMWGNTGFDLVNHKGSNLGINVAVRFSDVGTWADVSGGKLTFASSITSDPLFVNAAAGNLRLTAPTLLGPGSPCIDTASNALIPSDWLNIDDDPADPFEPLPLDYDLMSRVFDHPLTSPPAGDTVDMGAFETGSTGVPPGQ
jgi:hypothetical protein